MGDHHEQFSRYGFQVLSLVTVEEDLAQRKIRNRDLQLSGASSSTLNPAIDEKEKVKVVLPDGRKVQVALPSKDTTVRQFEDTVIQEHLVNQTNKKICQSTYQNLSNRLPLNFNLEAKAKPGISLDPSAPFFSFQVVLKYSIHACTHKEFQGLQRLTAKLRIKTEVTMTISNEKVEIYPSKAHNTSVECGINNVSDQSFLSHRPKSESYNLEDIVNCEVIVKK